MTALVIFMVPFVAVVFLLIIKEEAWGCWDVFVVLLFISTPHHQGEQKEEGQTRSHFIIWNARREERRGGNRGKYKSRHAHSRVGLVLG